MADKYEQAQKVVEQKKPGPSAIRIKRATCPDGIRIGNDGTHRQLPPRGGGKCEDLSLLPGQLVTAIIGGERYVWSAARFDSIVLEVSGE
jgi:hypothetical protein